MKPQSFKSTEPFSGRDVDARARPLRSDGEVATFAWICGFLAILLVAGFNLLFYNRYAPVPEGWFSVYADLIRKGQLPYRDIYFFFPPVYPFFIAAVQAVLGPEIIMLRIVGVMMIVLCAGALYKIIKDCFGPLVGLFTSVAGMIYYQTGVAHIGYDFIQLMNLATLLGGVCLMHYIRASCEERTGGASQAGGWAVATGIFCVIAMFTKHSNGLFISLAFALAVILAHKQMNRRWSLRGLAGYCIGFGVVSVVIALGLYVTNSLDACVQMIFFGAAASKGGFTRALIGFIPETFNADLVSRLMMLFILGLPLGFGSLWALRFSANSRPWFPAVWWDRLGVLAATGGLSAAILVPRFVEGGVPGWIPVFLSNYATLSFIPAAILGTIMLILRGSRAEPNAGTKACSQRRAQFFAGIISAGMLWGNGTSGGLSEGGAFLGLALFVGVLLSHGGYLRLGGLAVAVIVCLQLSIYTEVKYRMPYSWWGVQEADIRIPHEPARQPLLRGLWVTRERNALYDDITNIIRRETNPGDSILIYPQTPIFYLLSDRPVFGRAVVYWFDFLPDYLARIELERMTNNPPSLILWMEMPEEVYSVHERLFRAGHLSAQREFLAKFKQLLSDQSYEEIASISLDPNPANKDYVFRIIKRKTE